MEGFVNIGGIADFPRLKARSVLVGGRAVVVVNVDGDVHAFENNCPHQHFSVLHQGNLEGCFITCPMHGWTYDIKSGQSTNGNGRLKKFAVKSADGSVWIGEMKDDPAFLLFE